MGRWQVRGAATRRPGGKMDLILGTLGASLGTFMSYVIPFVFVLTVIVFFHELGHFLVARWCGVGIEAFSVGFGREIFGWTDRRGTRWKIGWLPLGGYVKFVGDMSPASNPADLETVPPELRDR